MVGSWRLASVLALLGAWVPAQALAWSSSRLESAQAQLDVADDGAARVRLWLGVRVLAGQLTELTLPKLDAALALDPDKPVTLGFESGDTRVPEVKVADDGTLTLDFGERRHAPRRGRYTVRVEYTLSAEAMRGEDGRVAWTFPATEEGLDDVHVWMTAPAGTRAQDVDPGIAVSTQAHGNRAHLSWRRVRVPQATPWPIVLELPARAPAHVAQTRVAATTTASHETPFDRRWPALAALVVLAALLVRARSRDLRRKHDWHGLALIPLRSHALRTMGIAVLGVLAGWLGGAHPTLALALLAAVVALALDTLS